MRIIIKVPDKKVNKFRLQRMGWKGRRFLTAAGLLKALERSFSPKNLREKPSIIVKQYIGSHFKTLNETLNSDSKDYLLFVASCFLEDYLSPDTLKKYEKPIHI